MSPAARRSSLSYGTEPVPWREVLIYIAVAFGSSWLICLGFWFSGTESLYGFSPNALAMLTPSAATFIVVFWVSRPRSIPRATALWPLRPVGRVAGYSLAALVLSAFLGFIATLLAGAIGVIELDLETFSMLRQRLSQVLPGFTGTEGTGFPPTTAVLTSLLVLFLGFVTALPFTFGEEWGWRGYLLPKLLPLGVWPALLLSGLIHGFWHAPLLLFRDVSGAGDLAVTFGMLLVVVVLLGVIFGWLRLASTSVWPAVIGHAAHNSFLMLGFVTLADADTETTAWLYPGGLTGVIGIAVLGAFVAILAVTGQIRTSNAARCRRA